MCTLDSFEFHTLDSLFGSYLLSPFAVKSDYQKEKRWLWAFWFDAPLDFAAYLLDQVTFF
jgi:hypothetical protein